MDRSLHNSAPLLVELGLLTKEINTKKRIGRKASNFQYKSKVTWLHKLINYEPIKEYYGEMLTSIFGSLHLAEQHIIELAESPAFRKGAVSLQRLSDLIKRENFAIRIDALIFHRFLTLSMFKAFQQDPRCRRYLQSGHMHLEKPLVFLPSLNFPKLYDDFKMHAYPLPGFVKPFFDFNDMIEDFVNNLKVTKRDWNDIWREGLKRMRLKEE